MTYEVRFVPEAQQDIQELYSHIESEAGAGRALAYIERLERYCLQLKTFPERGSRRDDVRPGLRAIGFERRVTIAFVVRENTVAILRVLYGGRELSGAFADPPG